MPMLIASREELRPSQKDLVAKPLACKNPDYAYGKHLKLKVKESKPSAIILIADAAEYLYDVVPDNINVLNNTFVTYNNDGEIIPVLLLSPKLDDTIKPTYTRFEEQMTLYKAPSAISPNITYVKSIESLKTMLEAFRDAKTIAFDVETTSLNAYDPEEDLYTIAFTFEDYKTFAMPFYPGYWPTPIEAKIKEMVKKFFEDDSKSFIAHNCKFDMGWMIQKFGVEITHRNYDDTSLMSYLLTPGRQVNDLKSLGFRFLAQNSWGIDIKNIYAHQLEDVLKYNALDTHYTMQLYHVMKEFIDKIGRLKVAYYEVLIPAMLEFTKVEQRGVIVDVKGLLESAAVLEKERLELKEKFVQLKGPKFNPYSSKQLIQHFQQKGYEWSKTTDSDSVAMDQEVIEEIVTKYSDDFGKDVLRFKWLTTNLAKYGQSFVDETVCQGRIHGTYSLNRTITGRTSSSNPNMQNFPKSKGWDTRKFIKPPDGYKLACFDYGQIEARMLGILTGDDIFCKALVEGYDIHLENSKFLFGEDRAKEMRQVVKAGTFALIYGAHATTVAKACQTEVENIKKLDKLIWDKFKTFRPWQNAIETEMKADTWITSLFGRRRYFPANYNQRLNYPCQSSASDITLLAMASLKGKYPVAFMVHDDLSFFLKDDDTMPGIIEDIAKHMTLKPWEVIKDSPLMKAWIPLAIECATGYNWSDTEEYGDYTSMNFGGNDLDSCLRLAKEL